MIDLEQRFSKLSLRAVGDFDTDEDSDFYIEGYGATFGNESTDDGLGFREIVSSGTFARSIRDTADVRCLRNHDPNVVLGRVKNGTLHLKEDSRGLWYRCYLDRNNPDHRSTHASVKRGDLSECSFGFVARKDSWKDVRGADGKLYPQRTLHDVDLIDVSPVCYPAYDQTVVVARKASLFPNGVPVEVRSRVSSLNDDAAEAKALLEKIKNAWL